VQAHYHQTRVSTAHHFRRLLRWISEDDERLWSSGRAKHPREFIETRLGIRAPLGVQSREFETAE
jgi:hypothetical protein